MLNNFIGVVFDGIAYGSLLFLISVGLAVTMGLMNFVNLAHGAFAMLGGYVCVTLLNDRGVPFLASLPVAFIFSALAGFILERLLYRRLYQASHLDQVLFTLGLTFMAVAGASFIWSPSQQVIELPGWLQRQLSFAGLEFGSYRLFLIAIVLVITLALAYLIEYTRFGAMIRASVDNQQASAGLGINVSRVFSLTFALGSGLAGLGGGLGIDVLGLDPNFAFKYLVYFLLVVAVGGTATIRGPLIAALILGVFDVAGKYYIPAVGSFVIYGLMVLLLFLFPDGLIGGRSKDKSTVIVAHILKEAGGRRRPLDDGRWHPLEIAFWLSPLIAYFLFPTHLLLISQIMIVGLFAVSLDLILGFGRIASLGHAAFFGVGAYAAGLLAVHGWGEPISGLLAAALAAGLFGLATSFLVVRGNDLARLMVTLGVGMMLYEAANKAAFITGGADGLSGMDMEKVLGFFSFDMVGKTAFFYSYAALLVLFIFLRRLAHSPFGLSLKGIREGERRMPAIGANVGRQLTVIFTVSAMVAGIAGALLAQTTQFVGLDSLGFHRSAELLMILVLGGTGRLYGALIGTIIFMLAHHYLSSLNPVYWQFYIGLLLVLTVLFTNNGIAGGLDRLHYRFTRKRMVREPA